jgi:hypothetical protein
MKRTLFGLLAIPLALVLASCRNQEILTVGEPRLWPKSGIGRKVQSSVP